MSYQVISVKNNKECVECVKKTYNEAFEVLKSIENVLALSGWKIKEDKVWRVNDGV